MAKYFAALALIASVFAAPAEDARITSNDFYAAAGGGAFVNDDFFTSYYGHMTYISPRYYGAKPEPYQDPTAIVPTLTYPFTMG